MLRFELYRSLARWHRSAAGVLGVAAPTGAPRRNFATQSLSTSSGPRRGTGSSSGLADLAFYGAPVVVTFSLGAWQVKRLFRKRHLIEERNERFCHPPIGETTALEVSTADPDALAYRKVILEGCFDHNNELLVGPRSAPSDVSSHALQWGGSSGFYVITPFRSESGHVYLVNTGWIPQRLRRPEDRGAAEFMPCDGDSKPAHVNVGGHTETRARIVVVAKPAIEERNRFTPDNQPLSDEWYYIDAPAMRSALLARERSGPPETAQLRITGAKTPDLHAAEAAAGIEVVELMQQETVGWPHPRPDVEFSTFKTPPSTHITYSATWFSLSLALALLGRQRFRTKRLQTLHQQHR